MKSTYFQVLPVTLFGIGMHNLNDFVRNRAPVYLFEGILVFNYKMLVVVIF